MLQRGSQYIDNQGVCRGERLTARLSVRAKRCPLQPMLGSIIFAESLLTNHFCCSHEASGTRFGCKRLPNNVRVTAVFQIATMGLRPLSAVTE